MDQTHELSENPAPTHFSLGSGNTAGEGRELLEWDFDAYVSRAGESWVDPLEFLIDDPTFGFGKPLLPLSLVDDRRHGRNRPIFQTEAQLAMIRGAARIVAQTAPMAIGALEALGNYVIGKGFTYEVADRPNRQAPTGLAACVQDVLDEFCDLNDWVGDRERELHNRVRRDGEVFTALYPDKNGIARTRFIEPERVTEPGNATDFEDWLAAQVPLDWVFGVRNDNSQKLGPNGYYHIVDTCETRKETRTITDAQGREQTQQFWMGAQLLPWNKASYEPESRRFLPNACLRWDHNAYQFELAAGAV